MQTRAASPRLGSTWIDRLTAAGPPLLFGAQLWASVCLALFLAFWIQLDNPYWAGTSAAAVCMPQLGASLRKGWFRMIGTVAAAVMIVVLTACFPQDRIGFLALLALWCGLCAFGATVLRNFASYGAALAGFGAAIIAANALGQTGGPSPEVFMLAIRRTSEICIGIVAASVVLAGTDLGGVERRLAASIAALASGIVGEFARMLKLAGLGAPDTQPQRRELVRRVIALEPDIDQAFGESSNMRRHAPTLRGAIRGLLRALDGWRAVATHLGRQPEAMDRQAAEAILRSLPPELRWAQEPGSPARWIADPTVLSANFEEAMGKLVALPAATPSQRLLADESAKVLDGILHVLDGLALLTGARRRPVADDRGFKLAVADWLPALVNGGRAFVAIGAMELLWISTAWPNGAFAIVVVASVVLMLSPKGDVAFTGAIAVTVAAMGSVVCAAIVKFAVLPAFHTFPEFCFAIGLFLVPVGFATAASRHPALVGGFTAMRMNVIPLLAPTNQMSYDMTQFYNTALAVVVGCVVAALAFDLLPPLSPPVRARRLLALTLRDLRRLAIDPLLPTTEYWQDHIYGRLAALPDNAEPLQRAELLAALSMGSDILHLRRISPLLGFDLELDAALVAVARGNSASARNYLAGLDLHLVSLHDAEPGEDLATRARARILAISEALAEHSAYFDAGVPA